MDWLTQSEIQKAAETSLLAAVRCSKKHWWQLATATARELRRADKSRAVDIDEDFCALCIRGARDCLCCVLGVGDWGTCCPEYEFARDKYIEWYEKRTPHAAFTKAARKLHKRLCAEERKLKG
jgi:hypothetical protein